VEAILLVGGQGSRLRPLTISTPKPMLPVAGVPFLTHPLTRARAAGVTRVVMATSYQPEVFEQHFGDGSALGLELVYVTEIDPLGTGGALRNVVEHLDSGPDDPVLVFNGDVLSGLDLAGLVAEHQRSGAEITLSLVRVPDPRAFGTVPTDGTGRVLQFLEKVEDPPTDAINAGTYVFKRRQLDAIPAGRVVSVERETFPGLLAAGGHMHGVLDASYWLDIGTPQALVRGCADVVLGVAPTPVVAAGSPALVLPGAEVDPTAVVDGGSTVSAGAVVGADAQVTGSVLCEGARVEAGARVRASVVGRDAVVGGGTVLDDVVVGDGASVGAGCELRGGARVFPGAQISAGAIRFSSDR